MSRQKEPTALQAIGRGAASSDDCHPSVGSLVAYLENAVMALCIFIPATTDGYLPTGTLPR